METERQTPDYSKLFRYQYGALAAQFLKEKDTGSVNGSLEMLVGKDGLNLGKEAEGFIRGTQASEKGIQTAVSIYLGAFEEARGEYSPADLTGWYSGVLSGLGDEESGRITQYLGKYKESWKEISGKVIGANHTLKGAGTGANTPEQIAEAQKTMEKYSGVFNLIGDLDRYHFEKLRPKATEKARMNELRELASRLPPVKTTESG